jgi:hypothetical protein
MAARYNRPFANFAINQQPYPLGENRMALYESAHTLFMREAMAQHPEWREEQRAGRAIWWDKKTDINEQKTHLASREVHRSYPYDVNFDQQ